MSKLLGTGRDPSAALGGDDGAQMRGSRVRPRHPIEMIEVITDFGLVIDILPIHSWRIRDPRWFAMQGTSMRRVTAARHAL